MYANAVRSGHAGMLKAAVQHLKHWCKQGPRYVPEVAAILGESPKMPIALEFLEAHPDYFAPFCKIFFEFRPRSWSIANSIALHATDVEYCTKYMRLGVKKYAEGKLQKRDLLRFFDQAIKPSLYFVGPAKSQSILLNRVTSLAETMLELDASTQADICGLIVRAHYCVPLIVQLLSNKDLALVAKIVITDYLTEADEAVLKSVVTPDVLQEMGPSPMKLLHRAHDLSQEAAEVLLSATLPTVDDDDSF
ncbi:unnamed protein product [Effrenium voratum]|nr:unnamed protein product [Effrenium voratum]